MLPNRIVVKFVGQQTVRDLDRMVARAVPAAAKAGVDLPEPVAAMGAAVDRKRLTPSLRAKRSNP
jgi:hypothetical protein